MIFKKQIYSLFFLAALVLSSLLSSGGAFAQSGNGLPSPAPPGSFVSESEQLNLKRFRGIKVMLWMFSTWCSSCAVAFEALGEQQPKLHKAGLRILALQNFENGGYPGPPLREFVERFGSAVLKAPNWTFGEVSKDMASRYNPSRYPDIYFLIDEQGMLQAVNGAPGSTMNTILKFAGVN